MRRRPAAERATDAAAPPLWTQQTLAGLRYAADRSGGRGLAELLPRLRSARAEWCRDNGCYRRPRTCMEIFGKPAQICSSSEGHTSG